jgi:cob(I)alamin adenosyltransferase
MGLPNQSVTLSVEQIAELNQKLSTIRHDINNNLSLILAAVELARYKPEMAERMMATLSEQPTKITAKLSEFSAEFERAVGITRT